MYYEFLKYLNTRQDVSLIEASEVNETITFQCNDLYFFFVYDKKDANYIRLMLPNIEMTEMGDDDSINYLNSLYKATKVIIINNSIYLATEQFVYSKTNVDALFARMIKVLTFAITDLREQTKSN